MIVIAQLKSCIHVLNNTTASLYNPLLHYGPIGSYASTLLHLARVVKLVDTTDLKSVGWKRLYRFKSGPGHQTHAVPHAQ